MVKACELQEISASFAAILGQEISQFNVSTLNSVSSFKADLRFFEVGEARQWFKFDLVDLWMSFYHETPRGKLPTNKFLNVKKHSLSALEI